jgi:hypothetical protein
MGGRDATGFVHGEDSYFYGVDMESAEQSKTLFFFQS